MRELRIIILGSVIILSLEGLYFLAPRAKPEVLSEKILASESPTNTPEPTSSPTPTTSPAPKPSPRKTPKPLPTPTPVSPAEVNAQVDRFSSQYGVDVNVMRHIGLCESGFNPNAVNGIYAGLFQFSPATWRNLRKEMGEDSTIDLRFSAEESAQTAAYALSKGKRGIWPECSK